MLPAGQRGFSLFELLVYILIASILFSAAVNRYREYPAEAERANFVAVLSQLKAGVNLQMMRMIAGASWTQSAELDGSNPMDLMLERPSNYLGEFSLVDAALMPGRVWYFDSGTGELVYIASNSNNLYLLQNGQPMSGNQLRFRITSVYSSVEEPQAPRWQGLILEAKTPYEWRSAPIEAIANSP